MSARWVKKPTDRLDYDVDLSRWLADEDVLVLAEATIEIDSPAGATASAVIDAIETYQTFVKVWADGGADGERYTVTVTATTSLGRTKVTCFQLFIRGCC